MKFDVAVVGGGPVGATAAVALAKAGLKIALIDKAPPPARPEGIFDARVSAVTRASERMLRALGVWAHLPAERIGVFREMHVWDQKGVGEIHFDAAEIAEPSLGFIVENRVLSYALGRRLDELPEVTVVRGRSVAGLDVSDQGVRVDVEGESIDADLVVGADGTRSRVREWVRIETRESSYEQRAVVVVVRCSGSHAETAWQRFLPGGPVAFLPLPDEHCCVVWSARAAQAAVLMDLPETEFARELRAVSESRLGDLSVVGPRGDFPLSSLEARNYVKERVALVGDAAHTIHPLAGQGVNLGLYDAAVLSEVVSDAIARGRRPYRYNTLRRYERWRRGHNQIVQRTMDMFFSLFGSEFDAVRRLRNWGLAATDRLDPVKRSIMTVASGLEGDLPALCRLNAPTRQDTRNPYA